MWVTEPVQTLLDVVSQGISPKELGQAVQRAVARRLVNASRLGARALDVLSRADAIRLWDSLPPNALNNCITEVFAGIARQWRVQMTLLDPAKHSEAFDPDWQLLVVVDASVEETQWELFDLLVHDLDWPLTNPPQVSVEMVGDGRSSASSPLRERARNGRRLG